MKLGLVLTVFTADPAKPLASAGRAAAAGYDAVFSSDHLFPPGAPDRPSLEPYTLLAAIAAAQPRLGVGVLVTRAGFRPLGMLAKQAAALDTVTGGRAVLGLGAGDATAAPSTPRSGWIIRRSPSALPSWRRPCSRSGRSSRGGRGPAGG